MVDQIIPDDSESDDSSTTSDVVTISSDNDAEDADHAVVSGSMQNANMCPMPDGDWLDTETLMSLLKDLLADICHSRASDGDKSDSYFLISNDDNIQRRKAGHARTFYNFHDNCGVWDKKSGQISVYPYVTDSHASMCHLFLINKQKQNGRRMYDLPQLQPTPDFVSTLMCYYIACGADADFHKRFTWLLPSVGAPRTEQESPYAVYEYRGKQPQGAQHGNAKIA